MSPWTSKSLISRARKRALLGMLVLACAAALASGCASGGPAEVAEAASEPAVLTFGYPRDSTGFVPGAFDECARNSGGRYTVEQLVLPPTVDGQREQMIRRLAAKDPSLDILGLDVIWTAEFARANWLQELTDSVGPLRDQFVEAPFSSVEYDEAIWAIPMAVSVPMLYYRTDIVEDPPETWQELIAQVKAEQKRDPKQAGYLWQANEYEGFTVDILELMLSAGAEVLSEDGMQSLLADTDSAATGLALGRELFESGVTPRAVTTFQEEEGRLFFQGGGGMFLRNWPYAYTLMNEPGSSIAGKFDVAPLPGFEGGRRAPVIGGLNWGVSAYSDHPELAIEATLCVAGEAQQKQMALVKGELPTRTALYEDAEIRKAMPFLDVVSEGLKVARQRPVTPYYNDVTVAIAGYSHRVITGRADPVETAEALDEAITLAVNGEGEI